MKIILLLLFSMLLSVPASAVPEKKPLHYFFMCVWDPLGKSGPGEKIMKEAKIIAFEWGIDLNYVVYSDEQVAIEEFKLGRCDAVNLLDFRARQFNHFTGSIPAIGALSSYEQLGVVLKTMSLPKAAPLMRVGDYEIIAFGPGGAIFGFTRDRTILLPQDFAGKKMAVLEGIPETEYLTKRRGITPVNSTIFNSFLKFNNGSVDLTAGPAIIYEPFEMYKGLDPNGGIYSKPFLHITMQVVARWQKLPEGIPQRAREKSVELYHQYVKFLTDPEKRIPERHWIHIPEESIEFWIEDFRQSRIELGKMNIYDPRTLKLMQKVRCKFEPNRAECSADVRE